MTGDPMSPKSALERAVRVKRLSPTEQAGRMAAGEDETLSMGVAWAVMIRLFVGGGRRRGLMRLFDFTLTEGYTTRPLSEVIKSTLKPS